MITIEPFGEITESSLTTAVCTLWDHNKFPPYGSIVAIDSADQTFYGIIIQSSTGPSDTTRTVHSYKKTDAELKRDHPHIFEFIHSWCTLIFIAYRQDRSLSYATPLIPPNIHAFVRRAESNEIIEILENPEYLHRLFMPTEVPIIPEEIIVALTKHYQPSSEQLHTLINELILIMGSDYRRIKILISRITKPSS